MSNIEVQSAERKRAKRIPTLKPPAPYMTRKELAVYLKEKHGVPVSKSAVEKLAAQGRLLPDRFYGQVHLYTPQTADRFADQLVSTGRVNLRLNKPPTDSNPKNT
jgi:hypothetical protein